MTWLMTDDQMYQHPKVLKLGEDMLPAMGLWSVAGSWCAGPQRDADGFVPLFMLKLWDTPRHKWARRLVDVGLWEVGEHDGEIGFFFHDWLDYQKSAAEKAAARAEKEAVLERRREGGRNRTRACRARKRARLLTGNGPGSDTGSGVIGDTLPLPPEPPLDPSELGEHDSLTGGPCQCNADGNASLGTHTHTSTSSGDLGGGGADPYERATNEPLPPRKPRRENLSGGLARPRLLRPLDADPKLCDEHWPLRYRDTHESVPKCSPCQTRRLRVEAVEAQTVDVEAKANALMAELRRRCDGCDPSGWELSEDGRTVVAPMRKHDCAAYALANEQMAAA